MCDGFVVYVFAPPATCCPTSPPVSGAEINWRAPPASVELISRCGYRFVVDDVECVAPEPVDEVWTCLPNVALCFGDVLLHVEVASSLQLHQ